MTLLQWIFVGGSLLLAGLGIPLARGRVKRNRWYGLRVPATLADETVWARANAATGRELLVLGIVLAILAALIPRLLPVSTTTYAAIHVGVTAAGVVALTVRGWTRANRLLRDLEDDPA